MVGYGWDLSEKNKARFLERVVLDKVREEDA
jgi:hypothetical protein